MNPDEQPEKEKTGTLVCFALDEEAGPFRKRALNHSDITILITGVGRKNAETALRRYLETHLPKLVLTCGFAGGLNPVLVTGEVVFMTGYPALEERLANADAKLAHFVTAPCISTTTAQKKDLRAATGADVVEMESGAIMAICREWRIPCAMVRAISDSAHEDLPLDFNKLSNPDMSLNYDKLLWAVVKSPLKIGALMRLHKHTRLAAERLAAVLDEFTSRQ